MLPASSLVGLHDRVLVSVVTPFLGSGYVILPFQRHSVKLFHIGLRVSLFVHALLILLVSEVALDGYHFGIAPQRRSLLVFFNAQS